MEDKQSVVTEKLETCQVQHGMGNSEIILMKKLDVFGILKESIKIPYKCPQFIFLTFLTSLPLFFTMILHEIILQASMSETKSYLTSETKSYLTPSSSAFYYLSYDSVLETLMMLFQNVYPKVFLLAFLYLVPLHLLDLYSAIITINSASIIYAEKTVRLGEMLLIPFKNGGGFTGPLLTSLYVLFFNCFVLSGLVWAVVITVLVLAIMNSVSPIAGIFIVTYGILFAVLAVKWIEWSAVWNMGIVFSVLDGRHKLAALGASDHFGSGNRKRGFQLMLLLCVWRIIFRFPCYFMGVQGRWVGLVATSLLSCIGNVLKWVVLTVYFYDCKKRTMEKNVDAECEKVASGNTRSTIHNDV